MRKQTAKVKNYFFKLILLDSCAIFLRKQTVLWSLVGLITSPALGNLPFDTLPEGFTLKRYETLWKRSPFTLESVVPELQKGFAADLMLVGTSTVGTNHYVMLVNSKNAQRLLVSETLNPNGISLVTITKHEDPTKVTATLKKGGETSIVKFDPAALKSMPTSPRPLLPTINPMMTNVMNYPGNFGNTVNRTPIQPFAPPDPQKFIRKRFPIPGENPEENKQPSRIERTDDIKPLEEKKVEDSE